MSFHFLTIGFSTKKMHVQAALNAGFKVSLLTTFDKYEDEFKNIFHKVLLVENIYNWQQIKDVIDKTEKIDAVVTRYEGYVSVMGAINQYLGLNGINYQTARNFCNKYSMKQKWLKSGVPCADGVCLDNLDKLDSFLEKHSFPMILKKTSAVHSNFVIKVDSKKDLFEKLEFFKTQVNGYVVSRPVDGYGDKLNECHFLLEEMLKGRELTVDTFVLDSKFVHTPICEYVLAHDLGINDSYLPIRTMPISLDSDQEKMVIETVEKALVALSAKNCVCHTELFFDEKNNSCRIIESTPRSGGNRAEMTRMTTEYDYNLAVFKAAANLDLQPLKKPIKAVCVVEYFAEKSGMIDKIDLKFLSKNKAVSLVKLRYGVGDLVKQAKFGGKTIASFFVEAENSFESKKIAIDLFEKVRKSIKLN